MYENNLKKCQHKKEKLLREMSDLSTIIKLYRFIAILGWVGFVVVLCMGLSIP